MPRRARLDVPRALHHIMVRGINKSSIFEDDQDRIKFLERLGENIIEAKCSVYAPCSHDRRYPFASALEQYMNVARAQTSRRNDTCGEWLESPLAILSLPARRSVCLSKELFCAARSKRASKRLSRDLMSSASPKFYGGIYV